MKNGEREARRWILQARDDARFVEWVREESQFFDKGCFVAQQAGEKALKACLYARGDRRAVGHSLLEMTRELAGTDVAFAGLSKAAARLDRFYIPARYPNGLPGGSPFEAYSAEDLERAAEDLSSILVACERFLRDKGVDVE
jgi:HEPN domain-containing protein